MVAHRDVHVAKTMLQSALHSHARFDRLRSSDQKLEHLLLPPPIQDPLVIHLSHHIDIRVGLHNHCNRMPENSHPRALVSPFHGKGLE